jgi:hypothetical protein
MKYFVAILIFYILAFLAGCSTSQFAHTRVQRKPLEKQRLEYKTPTNYDHRERGYDPKTGNAITYDHKPRVDLIDERSGRYAFKWIGYDGKEKSVVFQRGDVLDVVVSAVVSKTENQYVYTYKIENLPTSATYLKRFIVQNFASDVAWEQGGPLIAFSTMSNAIDQFKEGNWLNFADLSDSVQIDPGQTVQVQLTSAAPPGLVECRASIDTIMVGAGEDMPAALGNLLPGYSDFPKGYTIGPIERLKTLSSSDRVNYVLEKLPQFRDLGWITEDAFARYQQLLKTNNLTSVLNRLDEDLKSEQITTEVLALLRTIK